MPLLTSATGRCFAAYAPPAAIAASLKAEVAVLAKMAATALRSDAPTTWLPPRLCWQRPANRAWAGCATPCCPALPVFAHRCSMPAGIWCWAWCRWALPPVLTRRGTARWPRRSNAAHSNCPATWARQRLASYDAFEASSPIKYCRSSYLNSSKYSRFLLWLQGAKGAATATQSLATGGGVYLAVCPARPLSPCHCGRCLRCWRWCCWRMLPCFSAPPPRPAPQQVAQPPCAPAKLKQPKHPRRSASARGTAHCRGQPATRAYGPMPCARSCGPA